MKMCSWLKIGLIAFLFVACSQNNSATPKTPEDWAPVGILGPQDNPILSLKVIDTGLVATTMSGAYTFKNNLELAVSSASWTSWISNRNYKPAISSQFVISAKREVNELLVSDAIFSRNVSDIAIDQIDPQLSTTNWIAMYQVTTQIGAASDENTLLLFLSDYSAQEKSNCDQDGTMALLQFDYDNPNSRNIRATLLQAQPFEIYYTQNKRYFDGYFYITTSNGFAKLPAMGGKLEWFFHIPPLYCDIDLDVDTTLKGDALITAKDSIRTLAEHSQKMIRDIVVKGDSMFALDRYGTLLVSENGGISWDSSRSLGAANLELVRTPSFLGAKFRSQLFRFDINSSIVKEVDTRTFSTVQINDVAEFKGRLYLATDGGLFSKPLEDLEYLDD